MRESGERRGTARDGWTKESSGKGGENRDGWMREWWDKERPLGLVGRVRVGKEAVQAGMSERKRGERRKGSKQGWLDVRVVLKERRAGLGWSVRMVKERKPVKKIRRERESGEGKEASRDWWERKVMEQLAPASGKLTVDIYEFNLSVNHL